MRRIIKRSEPAFFKKWKNDFKDRFRTVYNPTFNDLNREEYRQVKSDLKAELISEQYSLCCYCCKGIRHNGAQIEHFRPRNTFKINTVDYVNLHATCEGASGINDHCGHKKGNWFDLKLTISPLDPRCESLFEYTKDGHILAANNNDNAIETIKKLNLDSYLLYMGRFAALEALDIFKEDFDDVKRTNLLLEFSTPDNGKLTPFCNIILYFLNQEI